MAKQKTAAQMYQRSQAKTDITDDVRAKVGTPEGNSRLAEDGSRTGLQAQRTHIIRGLHLAGEGSCRVRGPVGSYRPADASGWRRTHVQPFARVART